MNVAESLNRSDESKGILHVESISLRRRRIYALILLIPFVGIPTIPLTLCFYLGIPAHPLITIVFLVYSIWIANWFRLALRNTVTLALTPEGFYIDNGSSKRNVISWSKTTSFHICYYGHWPGITCIGYTYENPRFLHRQELLPLNFQAKASKEEVIALLKEWKERYSPNPPGTYILKDFQKSCHTKGFENVFKTFFFFIGCAIAFVTLICMLQALTS